LLPLGQVYDTSSKRADGPSEKRIRTDQSPLATGWKLLRIYVALLQNQHRLESTGPLVRILFDYLKLTFMEVDDNCNESTRQTLLYAIVNCVELRLSKRSSALERHLSKQSL